MKSQQAKKTQDRLPGHFLRGLLVLTGLLLAQMVTAQGWQQRFGANKTDEAWSVLEMIDGGFLVAGVSESGPDNDQDVIVVRTDIDGVPVWTKYYDEAFNEFAKAIVPTADGHYLIAGSIFPSATEDEDVYLLKIDQYGNQLWSKTIDLPGTERANDVVMTDDGGFVIVGDSSATAQAESDLMVMRFDQDGNLQWTSTFGTDRRDVGNGIAKLTDGFVVVGNSKNEEGFDNDIIAYRISPEGEMVWERRIASNFLEEGRDIVATKDGGVAIAGLINANPDVYVVKFDANGNQRWTRTIGEPMIEEAANAITELNDGSLVVAGYSIRPDGINVDNFLAKLDASGNTIWERSFGDENYLDEARDVQPTIDGGFIVAGYNGLELTFFNDITLVKTDGLGNVFSSILTGRVYQDEDGQCDADDNEPSLKEWLVKATGVTGEKKTYYGTTDENGEYNILVDTGSYVIDVIPVNSYWEVCLKDGIPVDVAEVYDTIQRDLGVQAAIECPALELDVSIPFIVACDNLTYTVDYRNEGTITAENAFVEFTLDDVLTYTGASIDLTAQNGKNLRFDIGDVPAGESGRFQVYAQSACEGIATDQAVLVEGRIFPDTLCVTPDPNWDGASIEVDGACDQDSIFFNVRNVGIGDMQVKRQSIVIQDDIIFQSIPFELEAKQDVRIKVPANGATYRVVAEQTDFHPVKTIATAAVEGCATDGTFTTGKVTTFPEDDQETTVSIDVQEVVDSVPSVELRGYPKGYKNALVAPETDLTYKVLFSNTGTDTINRLVIRDTLPNGLDLATLSPGASSHPATFELYGDGILKITMENVHLLPAGNTENDASASQGFVEFKLAQLPDNQLGTDIVNRVTVYFDYREPITTNTVKRTVDDFPSFVDVVDAGKVFVLNVDVRIYPNPFVDKVNFEISGETFKRVRFSLYDLKGSLLQTQTFNDNHFEFNRTSNLKTGLYIYKLESEGQLINSGKFLVR